MNIQFHIGHIILEGDLPSELDRHALQASLEQQLSHLLIEKGLTGRLEKGGAYTNAPVQDFHIESGDTAEQWGEHIGQAIYNGIS